MDVESTMLPLGTKMPNFNLLGIDGDMYTNEMFDVFETQPHVSRTFISQ